MLDDSTLLNLLKTNSVNTIEIMKSDNISYELHTITFGDISMEVYTYTFGNGTRIIAHNEN